MVAVNDGILLEACIFRILQRHFRDQQYYVQLMELFHEVHYYWRSLCRRSKSRTCRQAMLWSSGNSLNIDEGTLDVMQMFAHLPTCDARRWWLPSCKGMCSPLNFTEGDSCSLLAQTTYQTSHGQLLDLITAPIGTVSAMHCMLSDIEPNSDAESRSTSAHKCCLDTSLLRWETTALCCLHVSS